IWCRLTAGGSCWSISSRAARRRGSSRRSAAANRHRTRKRPPTPRVRPSDMRRNRVGRAPLCYNSAVASQRGLRWGPDLSWHRQQMPVDIEPGTLELAEAMPKDQPTTTLESDEPAREVAPLSPDDELQQIEAQIAGLWKALDEVVAQFATEREQLEERLRESEARRQKASRDIARL